MPRHPGLTEKSAAAIENRLAIMNLLAAYGHFANIGDIEGWGNCFYQDATYSISAPGAPGDPLPIAQVIAAETPQFAAYRRMLENPMSGERKIYCLVNTYVVEQTDSMAEVICELIQLRVQPAGPSPRIQLTGTYKGTLHKEADVWRIKRWQISTTRLPESVSEVPATWWLNVMASPTGDWRDPERS